MPLGRGAHLSTAHEAGRGLRACAREAAGLPGRSAEEAGSAGAQGRWHCLACLCPSAQALLGLWLPVAVFCTQACAQKVCTPSASGRGLGQRTRELVVGGFGSCMGCSPAQALPGHRPSAPLSRLCCGGAAKSDRLRQAKQEAEREVKAYKAQREEQYQKRIADVRARPPAGAVPVLHRALWRGLLMVVRTRGRAAGFEQLRQHGEAAGGRRDRAGQGHREERRRQEARGAPRRGRPLPPPCSAGRGTGPHKGAWAGRCWTRCWST